MKDNHYARLIVMTVFSFVSMYSLAMVDSARDVYHSLNQFYMAGLMTSPMVVIELLVMASMDENKKLTALVIAVSLVAGVAFFTFIRQQTAISDRQFSAVNDPPPLGSDPDV